MYIPLVDLKAQYQRLKSKIDDAILKVIEETDFIGGKYVNAFEKAYAEAYGVKHCISCANGTDAIYITLKMLGIGPGDEVITVANSWISTAETIRQVGARPLFVDIDEYFTIDVSKIEKKITPKTKAFLPVHLYGQPAEIDEIKMLCKKYNLLLIEDCAQAHFAEYKGQRVGTFGLAGTFSFYPGKNLGAYGDAGAIITNDDNLAVKMRMYANHGRIAKYDHEFEGRNSRLDGIQAAILDIKLRYLDNWTAKRIEIAEMYYDGLRNIGDVILPKREKWAKHVYHLFVIRSNKRDELQKHLNKNKIETGIHYPIALPKLEAYNHLDRFDYSMFSCKIDSEILSLPIGEHLDKNELEVLIQNILGFFQ